MARRVVITGLGVVAPYSIGVDEFMNHLESGDVLYDEIKDKKITDLDIYYGGQIKYSLPDEYFGKRFLQKCDDFSIYALHAVKEAIGDAKLNLKQTDRDRIGIYVGNSAGGWKSAEEGLYQLHFNGSKAISPYLASNWFPAAPQGHASIFFGLKGPSKTVTADMASSLVAIGNAYKLIKDGNADYMLAGGTEGLFSSWGLMFYKSSGMLQIIKESKIPYQPFSGNSRGMVLAEGAAFLLLEELESAKKRGVQIYGEITGYGLTNDGNIKNSARQYARCIELAREEKIPDVVFLNGSAVKNEDLIEIKGIHKAFNKEINNIKFTCPKAFYGHAYGAAGAMDTVIACKSMKKGLVLKTGLNTPEKNINFNLICKENDYEDIKRSLIVSRGIGGINASISISNEHI